MESILTSVKKLLNIDEAHTSFDADIIMHINSVFFTLHQLGVGPVEAFTIKDSSATWSDFISDDCKNFEAVKSYVGMRVRLMFDPPQQTSLLDALERQTKEYEFRLNVAAES